MALYQERVKVALERAVQEVFGQSLKTYIQSRNIPENVRVRQLAICLYHRETGSSMQEISRALGVSLNIVVYALQREKDNMQYNRVYSQNFVSLCNHFKKFI